MRYIIPFLAAVLGIAAAPAAADDAQDARSIVEQQLEAFAEDDWETAFGFAAPPIRAIFGDAETFSEMVRGGYAIVWRHREARYLDSRVMDDTVIQMMEFVDDEGRVWRAVYELVKVGDEWRINGVMAQEAPTEST